MAQAGTGHNSMLADEQLAEIADLHRKIEQEKKLAKAANERANAHRKTMRAMGINLQAYAASSARSRMEPDVRAEFDLSQANINKALNIPIQADLFADDGDDNEEVHGDDGVDSIPAGALN